MPGLSVGVGGVERGKDVDESSGAFGRCCFDRIDVVEGSSEEFDAGIGVGNGFQGLSFPGLGVSDEGVDGDRIGVGSMLDECTDCGIALRAGGACDEDFGGSHSVGWNRNQGGRLERLGHADLVVVCGLEVLLLALGCRMLRLD